MSEGTLLASVEADKASMDISAPVNGKIIELFAHEGDKLAVGQPLLTLKTANEIDNKPITEENSGTPILKRKRPTAKQEKATPLTNIKKTYIPIQYFNNSWFKASNK